MTATSSAPVRQRDKVGWGDLVWLTWRQHRSAVLAVGCAAVLASAAALGMAAIVASRGSDAPEFFRETIGYIGSAKVLSMATTIIGGLIAVFWAAPLLSAEYERKTHVVAWGQDLTPARWLLGKVVLLTVPAAALSAALGASVLTLQRSVNAWAESAHDIQRTGFLPFRAFGTEAFEAAPLVQVGYAVFGFALGLALSALTRRTVVAMAVTLGLYVVVRALVGGVLRRHYWTPERVVEPFDAREDRAVSQVLREGMWVDSGYLDAAGTEVPYPVDCGGDDYERCVADRGIVSYFVDHHPADRVVPFQLVEFAIFGLLAAGLLALTFALVRRTRRL